jgi:hypothetical protein
MDFAGMSKGPRRIVGVAADVDDEHVYRKRHSPSIIRSARCRITFPTTA